MARATRSPLTRAEVVKLLSDAEEHRTLQNRPRQDRVVWNTAASALEEIERRLMRALPNHDSQNIGPGSAYAKERTELTTVFHQGWVKGFDTIVDQICQLVGA